MLHSMTAFGRKETPFGTSVLAIEMRSVNHRYLELSVRLPEELRPIETAVRERLGQRLKRGKVDIGFRVQPGAEDATVLTVNRQLAGQLLTAAVSLREQCPDASAVDLVSILAWPGVIGAPSVDTDALQQAALVLLDNTLNDFVATREREGQQIERMLRERIDTIEHIVAEVRRLRPQVLQRQREKLLSRLADIDTIADPGRLEQELLIAAHKLDVDEELDRLSAHIEEVRKIFKRDEPVGRRLDFLIQEFNREANTLGSKSSDTDTTGHSVELKVLIEQMREQVQNVE